LSWVNLFNLKSWSRSPNHFYVIMTFSFSDKKPCVELSLLSFLWHTKENRLSFQSLLLLVRNLKLTNNLHAKSALVNKVITGSELKGCPNLKKTLRKFSGNKQTRIIVIITSIISYLLNVRSLSRLFTVYVILSFEMSRLLIITIRKTFPSCFLFRWCN